MYLIYIILQVWYFLDCLNYLFWLLDARICKSSRILQLLKEWNFLTLEDVNRMKMRLTVFDNPIQFTMKNYLLGVNSSIIKYLIGVILLHNFVWCILSFFCLHLACWSHMRINKIGEKTYWMKETPLFI